MTRRAEGLTISWYPEDREALRADAKRAGLPVSAYLRGLWLAARTKAARAKPPPARVVTAEPPKPRKGEKMAGAWESVAPGEDRRIGPKSGAHATAGGWAAYCGRNRCSASTIWGLSANRDAADAWLRSRGVVLA